MSAMRHRQPPIWKILLHDLPDRADRRWLMADVDTLLYYRYPPQNGISSSVMVLVLGADEEPLTVASATAVRRCPLPVFSPAPPPRRTISRARISVVLRLLPS